MDPGRLDMLLQVLLNLLLNSASASPPGSQVLVSLLAADETSNWFVTDPGAAWNPTCSPTPPNHTSPDAPVAMAWDSPSLTASCQLHGWELAIDSAPSSGTTVTISGIIPAHNPPEANP
jgi:signal transduction histidine kinase